MDRREFGGGATLVGLAAALARARRAAAQYSPIQPLTAPCTLGLIGAGLRGKELARAAAQIPGLRLKTVCDTALAEQPKMAVVAPQAEFVTDYRRLLDDRAIDGVIVATPTHQHRQIAVDALATGKHVYCEAPLAGSIDDVAAICRAAVASGRILESGLWRRRFPLYQVFRSTSLGGGDGWRPVSLRSQWRQRFNWRRDGATPGRAHERSWRIHADTSLGPALELGIHQIDLLNFWTGLRPTRVSGVGQQTTWADQGWDVPDTTLLTLDYPGVVHTLVESSTAVSAGGRLEEVIMGDGAVLYLDRDEHSAQYWFVEPSGQRQGWEIYARKRELLGELAIVLRGSADEGGFSIVRSEAGRPPWTSPLVHSLRWFVDRLAGQTPTTAKSLTGAYAAHVIAIRAAGAVRDGTTVTFAPDDFKLA
ncbi:MAG: Gfo/Idh/MocA family oxidoreductase [Armatimonadetes bacterium]|nr:Gfo/Idh/MocA family oxidoreductase [Armatimonadota bacterium]